MRRSRKFASVAAFTLVELLVVVAVISVLASLLLPVLRNSITRARTIQCLGNLSQVALARGLYADDYHRYIYPIAGSGYHYNNKWQWAKPYMPSDMLHCASDYKYPIGTVCKGGCTWARHGWGQSRKYTYWPRMPYDTFDWRNRVLPLGCKIQKSADLGLASVVCGLNNLGKPRNAALNGKTYHPKGYTAAYFDGSAKQVIFRFDILTHSHFSGNYSNENALSFGYWDRHEQNKNRIMCKFSWAGGGGGSGCGSDAKISHYKFSNKHGKLYWGRMYR